jgi:hypothetical protein
MLRSVTAGSNTGKAMFAVFFEKLKLRRCFDAFGIMAPNAP